jgi:2-iminobutanoate/2-iminopropanoate deaminase
MKKTELHTDMAPAAVGPYSQGIRMGNLIFVSGQLGIDPAQKKMVEGGVEAQARQIFKNIAAVLATAGAGLDHVLKATVFLKDMADFKTVNAVYETAFQKPFPARSAFSVKQLPLDADVEIEVIAGLEK